MSQTTKGNLKTFASATDLEGKEGYIVKQSSDVAVGLSSAGTDKSIGVLVNAGKGAGDNVVVAMCHGGGTFKVKTGGAVTRGAYLTADSAGKAVATTSAGDIVIGVCIQAGDSGDVVEAMPTWFKLS